MLKANTGIKSMRLAINILLVAGLIYAGVSLYAQAVWLGHVSVVLFCLLMLIVALLEVIKDAGRQNLCAELSLLRCPECGAKFGKAAADAAFQPRPVNPHILTDDFGFITVKCETCKAQSTFQRGEKSLCFINPTRSI